MITANPRRPHQFQTSDSRFEIAAQGAHYWVVERWWFINRNREEEDGEAMHGPFSTQDAAIAEKARLEAL